MQTAQGASTMYIILFEDAKGADPNIRKDNMSRHLDFLEANADKIDAAGPLSDPDGLGRDGLWIVRVDTPQDAMRLVHEDPFWPTGLRQSVSIIPWKQVYANGKRRISV
jgi:uncharacterized protein YciI